MAKVMSDEQRLATLEAYNPQEHLISVGQNKGQPVLYYPAAWRLYELRLRHPHFTLEAEILHMDEEKGTVIVKAIGYDGVDYASSNLKGTAMKQGRLAELDKVETKAMSRVARNIGIGTEYALDMDPDETDATHDAATTASPHSQRSPVASSSNRQNVQNGNASKSHHNANLSDLQSGDKTARQNGIVASVDSGAINAGHSESVRQSALTDASAGTSLSTYPMQSEVVKLAKLLYPNNAFKSVVRNVNYLNIAGYEDGEELTPDQVKVLYEKLLAYATKHKVNVEQFVVKKAS